MASVLQRLDYQQIPETAPRDFVIEEVDGRLFERRIIGTEVVVDEKRGKVVPIEQCNLYAQAEAEKSRLVQAMTTFQAAARSASNRATREVEIENDTTKKFLAWEDVLTTMREAQERYSEKHKGRMPAAQAFWDKLGNNGDFFKTWLSLLPDGDYTSVICGAFKLVINASARISEVRDLIFSNLGKIPATLAAAAQYLELNNLYKSWELHSAFSSICASILVAFKHMLEWFSKSPSSHGWKALFKQNAYGDKLKEKIAEVEECAEKVRREAQRCSQVLLGRVHQVVSRNTIQLEGMTVTMEGVKGGVEKATELIRKQLESQGHVLNEILRLVQDKFQDDRTASQPRDAKNIDYQQFQDDTTASQRLDAKNKRRKGWTSATLKRSLGCDMDMVQRDIDRATSGGSSLQENAQDLAQAFINTAKLIDWLTSQTSRILLANGNSDSSKISPMSLACGILASSTKSFAGAVCLSYFCGMHSDTDDPESCAGLMMASLVSQLLQGYPKFNLEFLGSDSYKKTDLQNHDIRSLCALFVQLVSQLPKHKIVFILIDGINFFEYGKRGTGTRYAIQQLINMIEIESAAAICKLLVTSPAKSILVSGLFGRLHTLNLQPETEASGQAFNTKRYLAQRSKSMGALGREFQSADDSDGEREVNSPDKSSSQEEGTSSDDSESSEASDE